ncbi:hypothetical protein [Clostridium sp.]|uniref:hypothetical protein n=1 Tax=Clostridium sp. TaxID=1506 RepID=UPI003216B6A3
MTDKEKIEELEKKVEELEKKQNLMLGGTCSSCEHFYQHYGKSNRAFYELNCGHCATPRIKHKSPTDKACSYFKGKEI